MKIIPKTATHALLITGFFAAVALGVCGMFDTDNLREEGESFYGILHTPRSPQWPRVRAEMLKEHPCCLACTLKSTVVHHIAPFHEHPELELVKTNLICLCSRDHLVFGHPSGNTRMSNPNVVADCLYWKAHILSINLKTNTTDETTE